MSLEMRNALQKIATEDDGIPTYTPQAMVEIAKRALATDGNERLAGEIAYQLTKRLVIDMPTARAAVDAALSRASIQEA